MKMRIEIKKLKLHYVKNGNEKPLPTTFYLTALDTALALQV